MNVCLIYVIIVTVCLLVSQILYILRHFIVFIIFIVNTTILIL